MYTYDMYRLVEMDREEMIQRLRRRLKEQQPLPQVAGHTPDLATPRGVFFVAENADRMATVMPAISAFAESGREVVLVVPEPFGDTAGEAWDYLPEGVRQRVKIMPMPVKPNREEGNHRPG